MMGAWNSNNMDVLNPLTCIETNTQCFSFRWSELPHVVCTGQTFLLTTKFLITAESVKILLSIIIDGIERCLLFSLCMLTAVTFNYKGLLYVLPDANFLFAVEAGH